MNQETKERPASMIARLGYMELGGQGREGESPGEYCERGAALYHQYVETCQERGSSVVFSRSAAINTILLGLETGLTPERARFIRHNAMSIHLRHYTFGWLHSQVMRQHEILADDMEYELECNEMVIMAQCLIKALPGAAQTQCTTGQGIGSPARQERVRTPGDRRVPQYQEPIRSGLGRLTPPELRQVEKHERQQEGRGQKKYEAQGQDPKPSAGEYTKPSRRTQSEREDVERKCTELREQGRIDRAPPAKGHAMQTCVDLRQISQTSRTFNAREKQQQKNDPPTPRTHPAWFEKLVVTPAEWSPQVMRKHARSHEAVGREVDDQGQQVNACCWHKGCRAERMWQCRMFQLYCLDRVEDVLEADRIKPNI